MKKKKVFPYGNLNYFNSSIRIQLGKQPVTVSEKGSNSGLRSFQQPQKDRKGKVSRQPQWGQISGAGPKPLCILKHWKIVPPQLVASTPVGLKGLPPTYLAVSTKAGDLEEILKLLWSLYLLSTTHTGLSFSLFSQSHGNTSPWPTLT